MIEVSEEPIEPPQEPIKRKRGRPPGSKNKVETAASSSPETTAQSAGATDRVETSGELEPYPEIAPTSTPEAIFTLWNSLSSRQRQFGNIYLYRDDPKLLLVKQGSRLVNENVQKFNDEDGPISRESIWKKHRSGMFTLRLVQRITDPKGEISNAKLKLAGDYANTDEMPIFDLARLDWEHPDNQSYVRILKLRGVNPPGQGGTTTEETDEMAASEVLGNIADKAIDRLSERHDQPAQASDSGAVKEVVSLLRETINNSKPPEQQGSVTDHVKSLVEIAKAMAPPAVNLQPFMDLQQQNNSLIEQIMKKDVERAESAAEAAKQEAAELRAAMPKAKTIDEQFDDLEKAALRYKRIRGESEEPEERNAVAPVSSGMGFWGALPSILEKGTVMLSLIANIGFNWAVSKTGAGAAVNPATGRPETAPAEPALSAEQQEQAERMNAVIQQLVPLASPMMRHLQQGKSGTDFAKFVFENYGPESIAVIQNVEGGRATILGMLQNYPPVWSQVANSEHNLQRFTLFLDQFLTYQNSTVQ